MIDDENSKVVGPSGGPADATTMTMANAPRVIEKSDTGLPPQFTATGVRIRNRIWALINGGVVRCLRETTHPTEHPFSDDEMSPKSARAVDVSNTDCQVGYLADEKGNVTPPGVRTTPIPPGQPAYHDTHVVAPPTSQESALKFGLAGMTGSIDAEEMAARRAAMPSRLVNQGDVEADLGPGPETTPPPPPPPTSTSGT